MSLFKPRFLLLALGCALVPMTLGSGCGGDAFTSAELATGGTSAGAPSEPSDDACHGPEECDDGDSCTTDLCGANGVCTSALKCSGTQRCCDGDCAECCGDADCDDGVSCTENTCFMGQCMYVPKDSRCGADQFCSTKHACRPRQVCNVLAGEDPLKVCDDDDGCTTDACGQDNFCQHDFCTKLCCPGSTSGATEACASDCCNDAQCDTDRDPCTVGSCSDGKCSIKPLCATGELCCPNADGKTATCGECCAAADCDDHHGCTEETCANGQCSVTPLPDRCDAGYVCDLDDGCVAADKCGSASDCMPRTPCQINPQCSAGLCKFDSCAAGSKCCKTGCGICCSDEECNDHIDCTVDSCDELGCVNEPKAGVCGKGQLCDPQLGCVFCLSEADCDDGLDCTTDTCNLQHSCTHTSTCDKLKYCTSDGCADCVRDSDCQGSVVAEAISLPGCTVQRCFEGKCEAKTESCDKGFCCPPYGCLQQQCTQNQ